MAVSQELQFAATSDATHVPSCPLTGTPMALWQSVPVDGKKGAANPYCQVYFCRRSGYGRVHPVPSSDEVVSFYQLPAYYTHGTENDQTTTHGYTWLDRLREHLAWRFDRGQPLSPERIDALLGRPACTVCDIGCGDGRLAARLAEFGHHVVGVELDPSALTRARHGGGFEVFAGSAEQLPEPVRRRRFDCVTLSHVLEHTRDPMQALRNVREILAPGGLLVCEVPNNEALALRLFGAAWEMFDVPRHLHFFTARSLTQFCERAGFRVESVAYAHYFRQVTNDIIAKEQQLYETITSGLRARPLPGRATKLRAWGLLAATCCAPRRFKYDSVSVVARRPREMSASSSSG
jgi:2-polyprenyl-3-methyl-5-hydroxy-6-metoxy-1,4-benzoquinol methylase